MTDQQLTELQEKSKAQFSAKVLADSVNVCGNRLTTWEVTYPRIIHSEMLRHRIMSRNAASSRAVPIERFIGAVIETPFIPLHIGAAQGGMQAFNEVDETTRKMLVNDIADCRFGMTALAEYLSKRGVHKQVANRYLEPFLFITEIISTTSFRHFELLRDHPMAEPHIQIVARMMSQTRSESIPELLQVGQWHLPLIYEEDKHLSLEDQKKVSVARCARVSYVRQNEIKDYADDFALHDRLVGSDPKHASPTEHQATPEVKNLGALGDPLWVPLKSGNFLGWKQYRKEIIGEFIPDEPYTGPTR